MTKENDDDFDSDDGADRPGLRTAEAEALERILRDAVGGETLREAEIQIDLFKREQDLAEHAFRSQNDFCKYHEARHAREAHEAATRSEQSQAAKVAAVESPPAILADHVKDFAQLWPIRRDADTEDLLNGLIAQCHFGMRSIALPSAIEARNDQSRDLYLVRSMDFATAGAKVGKSIAKLRASTQIAQARQPALIEALARLVSAEKV